MPLGRLRRRFQAGAGCGRCASGSPCGVITLTVPGIAGFAWATGAGQASGAVLGFVFVAGRVGFGRAAVALEVGAFFDHVAVGAEGARSPQALEVGDELAEDVFLGLLLELGFDLRLRLRRAAGLSPGSSLSTWKTM